VKVLVTGAGGNLGRVVLPALAAGGHAVRAADSRPLDVEHEFVQLDVRDREAVAAAVQGVDAIVHAAAIHGVHLEGWSAADFWSINVDGTFNVYDAAREAGVDRIVLCSTMGVYGSEGAPEAWAVVTEESPVRPKDVYGLSKAVCEQIAEYHARVDGIGTVALRLGMFVPETFERYGFRLLFGGVDDRDVADAVVLALGHDPAGGFDVFDVMADTPFEPEDARELARDPAAAIERHWPGATDDVDVDSVVWGWALWPVEKAKRELGWRPRYGFPEFLEAFRRGDTGHYPFAGLPQWGVR
jgi:nucleoside-diphosphate-sugar epimerase